MQPEPSRIVTVEKQADGSVVACGENATLLATFCGIQLLPADAPPRRCIFPAKVLDQIRNGLSGKGYTLVVKEPD